MSYVELPITTDQQTLQDNAFDYVQGKVDGYRLDPAHPMTWLIEACGRMVAVALFQASLMPPENLRTLGQTVYGIPRGDGAPARASVTWTAVDTLGHDIPSGTAVLIDGVPFTTDEPAAIPAGSSSTTTTATALDVGTSANDLGQRAEAVDALAWVSQVAVVGSTGSGQDAETDEAYLDRLTTLLRLQGPRAITPADFEVFTLNTTEGARAGVSRAVVLDLLDATNPASPVANQEGHVTIAVEYGGLPVAQAVKDSIAADLDVKRVLNLVVHIVDPSYTNVTITYNVVAYDGFDKAALQVAIDAALASYFDGARWGNPPFGETARWVNTPVVRYLQVARVIENVEGVEHISSLTINGGTADVTLPGIAPLPRLQAITTHGVS